MGTQVLVVDDDEALRETLRACLRDEGYCVDEAPDGLTALACLRTCPQSQVVLLDIRMPVLDGHQVLEAVAADPELAQRHVYLLLSASTDVHHLAPEVSQLMADHCVGVLDKPFDLDQLLALIEEAASRLT